MQTRWLHFCLAWLGILTGSLVGALTSGVAFAEQIACASADGRTRLDYGDQSRLLVIGYRQGRFDERSSEHYLSGEFKLLERSLLHEVPSSSEIDLSHAMVFVRIARPAGHSFPARTDHLNAEGELALHMLCDIRR